jgi:hypothetical protein
MTLNSLKSGALLLFLALLAGCAAAPVERRGTVTLSRCPANFHTEAYPNNRNPRKAYGCVSDTVGFLRTPGDERERMRPR